MNRKIINYAFAVISILSVVGAVVLSQNSFTVGAFLANIPIIFSALDLWCVAIYFSKRKAYSTKKQYGIQ